MKRDNEYLRGLLFNIEAEKDFLVHVRRVLDASPDDRKHEYHIELLCDAGLMTQVSDSGFRLSSQGHDFLDAIRSDTVWNQTKAAVSDTGGSATLEIIKSLAVGFVKQKIKKHTGIEV